ncbi:MAG: hypothetical protein COV45_09090 [Deltaproteobacteria bacterium CG11_big_fil_rev_8_21_14_0_20_47_16]|nr:MAG: hypothetical protein COV45_09090 [Deltaproteobacteria bacterium CG11_big_fil_rev_8_21_14_0_20_47_16]
MARIGILGGSFNPPHNGHIGIAQHVLRNDWVDEVWVIPCLDHPYGKTIAPFLDRIAMCQLAFQGIEHVIVSDFESQLSTPSYTVQTLRALKQKFSHDWSLIVGSDISDEVLSHWKDGAEIPTLAPLLLVPRGPRSPIPNVSATNIRKAVQDGTSITALVPEPVAQYIQSHQLYQTR